MRFNDTKAIYLQIADYVSEQILLRSWLPDEKIPSTRELAVAIEVNPNTVIRSYNYLEVHDIIYMRRGVGFFVTADAMVAIRAQMKKAFIEEEIPKLIKTMQQLEMTVDDLKAYLPL